MSKVGQLRAIGDTRREVVQHGRARAWCRSVVTAEGSPQNGHPLRGGQCGAHARMVLA